MKQKNNSTKQSFPPGYYNSCKTIFKKLFLSDDNSVLENFINVKLPHLEDKANDAFFEAALEILNYYFQNGPIEKFNSLIKTFQNYKNFIYDFQNKLIEKLSNHSISENKNLEAYKIISDKLEQLVTLGDDPQFEINITGESNNNSENE